MYVIEGTYYYDARSGYPHNDERAEWIVEGIEVRNKKEAERIASILEDNFNTIRDDKDCVWSEFKYLMFREFPKNRFNQSEFSNWHLGNLKLRIFEFIDHKGLGYIGENDDNGNVYYSVGLKRK